MSKSYDEFTEDIENLCTELVENIKAGASNKAASRRARKNSTDLTKLTKEYRKFSVEREK